MDFLVTIEVRRLDVSAEEEHALRAQERARGEQFITGGQLQRIWRLPGSRASISVWSVADATALHGAVSSFPLFPWMDVSVVSLADHYLQPSPHTSEPS